MKKKKKNKQRAAPITGSLSLRRLVSLLLTLRPTRVCAAADLAAGLSGRARLASLGVAHTALDHAEMHTHKDDCVSKRRSATRAREERSR